jgi:hypothetical protein
LNMFFIVRPKPHSCSYEFMTELIAGVHSPSVFAHSFTALVMHFTLITS